MSSTTPPPSPEADAVASQVDASVVARLRRRIAQGAYPPGSRLTEDGVAEALGVSRTPVRLALRTLEQEGLLHKTGKRGLVVRAFSEADVLCAVEVRGVLEGLAARRLAERGAQPAELAVLNDAVQRGRQLLASASLTLQDIGTWSALNRDFHNGLVQAGGSAVIADAIARNNHLPFASADSIALGVGRSLLASGPADEATEAHPDSQALAREHHKLRIAQLHHELVLEAVQQRESARAELLMREHAYIGLRYARWC